MAHTMEMAGRTVEDRLDGVAWGFVFLLVGALALPSGSVEYASVAGVGILLLGLNAARVAIGQRVGWFSVALGAWAVIGGLAALGGVKLDAFALFFLILGVVTAGVALLRPR